MSVAIFILDVSIKARYAPVPYTVLQVKLHLACQLSTLGCGDTFPHLFDLIREKRKVLLALSRLKILVISSFYSVSF